MISILKNKDVTIKVKSLGAELVSFKKNSDNFEYLWSGNAEFWGGQSPVLFPIISSLVNGRTKIDGKNYYLKNHGFARKTEFKLIGIRDNQLFYSLKYNKTTLAIYPFKFDLQLIPIL